MPVIVGRADTRQLYRARFAEQSVDDYGTRWGRLDFGRVDDSDLERLVDGDAQPAVSQRDAQHGRADAGDGHGVRSTSHRGDVTFRFVNSWNYTVGNYTQTVTFTLSSP